MMEETRKTKRGGARKGAGRKPALVDNLVNICVPRHFVGAIQAYVRAAAARRKGAAEIAGRRQDDVAHLHAMSAEIAQILEYIQKLDAHAAAEKLSDFEKRQMNLFD